MPCNALATIAVDLAMPPIFTIMKAEKLTDVTIDIVAIARQTDVAEGVTKITGYTKHGLNQALGRDGGKGVKATEMLEAIRNPKKIIQQADGAAAYRGKKTTVVLNKEGKVITTFGKSRGPQIWQQGASPSVKPQGSGSAQRKANELGFSYLSSSIR